ncbi:uncharacterized protein YaiI (UPF0178 family) [Scopulibacillus daqui]|uniref:UPF0178 protein JOD45_002008 n=1 Tax=Scopulibacillus daqui TaxID=1469162 RepID=A0ABS2Q0H5_9BACL|nr:DUF188 domain-containing protein [Scopulibacillus daqui]MBM7645789.1 uncharacterized protein YaiI (UPF0178 family) [Scopulibacillus daqui]
MLKKRRLFVDADACPVKKEIEQVAAHYPVSLIFVASYSHYSIDSAPGWIYVDPDKEAADIYIVNHAEEGDIVVTQDMGLSSLLTHKHVYVLTPGGNLVKEKDMPNILHRRYMSYKQLAQGNRIKGPKPFSLKDRQRFCRSLENLLSQLS